MKKFLTFVLVLAMVMSVSSVALAGFSTTCPGDSTCAHKAAIGTTHYDTLQEAVDAAQDGDTVILLKDCDESVTVTQKPDVKITIDGNNKSVTMSGTITVDGKSAAYATAGLTILNVKFDATGITKDACINMGVSGNSNTRYVSNLTVEGCTFTGTGKSKVAIKSYTGGDKNLIVKNCEASGLHSLMQLANVAGVTIEGCEISESGRGIALGKSTNAIINDCEISADSYGIRGDASTDHGSVTISDTEVTAAQPVAIRQLTGSNKYTLTVENDNAFTPADDFDAISYAETGEETRTSEAAKANATTNGGVVAKNGDTFYTGVQEALNNANAGDVVEVLADTDEKVTVPDGVTMKDNGHKVEVDVPNTNAPSNDPTTTSKPSGSGISVKYNGGNSFSTSNPSVPTGVEIDGVPVTFNGTGSNFSVGCISSDAKWVTVRWNSTTVTTNFTPDGLVECTTVSIPKTGDMSFWAAIAQFLGF